MLEHLSKATSVQWSEQHMCGALTLDGPKQTCATYMRDAAQNAPLFIEAMIDACRSAHLFGEELFAPDAEMINRVLVQHGVGYEVREDELLSREGTAAVIAVPAPPTTMTENAAGIVRESLSRSNQLLSEGRAREAVQEIVWLLETISTAFRETGTATGTVGGTYFNRIVQDLRRINRGTTLENVLRWIETLHGFLSSPTGGGVRHGIDLIAGIAFSPQEARLICNLIRSYIAFLLAEHERLVNQVIVDGEAKCEMRANVSE